MSTGVAAAGDADELSRFRRLVNLTIVATFVLILIGGVVRVSDSGLGLRRRGQRHARLAAVRGRRAARRLGGVGDRVLAPACRDRRRGADRARSPGARCAGCAPHRFLVRGSIAAGVLVLAQAGLGGLTVETGLEDELVAAHLGLAMVLLGLLIWLRRGAAAHRANIGRRFLRLEIAPALKARRGRGLTITISLS